MTCKPVHILTPPLTVTRQISTANAAGLKVTIYIVVYATNREKDLPKSTCEEIKDRHQSLDNKR
ncbi:hypothetical protein T09_11006 [Trichinella sp. T9]|nr:hypothetical protein T09_11006 [Trichinella sp. T9]